MVSVRGVLLGALGMSWAGQAVTYGRRLLGVVENPVIPSFSSGHEDCDLGGQAGGRGSSRFGLRSIDAVARRVAAD